MKPPAKDSVHEPTPAPVSDAELEQLRAEELDPGSGQSLPMEEEPPADEHPRRPSLFGILARGEK